MRTFLIILGSFISIASLFALGKYAVDFAELSHYGKGYVIGQAVLLILGVALIYIGAKKKKGAKS
jgi:membrane protein DedA with SNARE-associated domain